MLAIKTPKGELNMYKLIAHTFAAPIYDEAFRQALYRVYRGRCQYCNEDNSYLSDYYNSESLQIDHIIPCSKPLEDVYENVYNRLKRWKGVYKNMSVPEGVVRDICERTLPPNHNSILNLTLACRGHNCEWKIDGLLPIDELVRVLKIAKRKATDVLKMYTEILRRKKSKIKLMPFPRQVRQKDFLQGVKKYDLLFKKLEDERDNTPVERIGSLVQKNNKGYVKIDMIPTDTGKCFVEVEKDKIDLDPNREQIIPITRLIPPKKELNRWFEVDMRNLFRWVF